MHKLYHGCRRKDVDSILRDIRIDGRGFHLAVDKSIAEQYFDVVICFEVEADYNLTLRPLDKGGDVEEDLKSGLEHVIASEYQKTELYKKLWDVYVVA